MKERLITYIEDNELFTTTDKLLVAVSGGQDSMMLLTLLYEAGFSVEIAHCNFHLRAEDSDADEYLVRSYGMQFNIPVHVAHFDTTAYAAQHGISIQMAARDLRYEWFESLANSRNLDYIAIAQHKNDHVETILLNLVRGTGLSGLLGIHNKRRENNIVRPMLFLDRKEIESYVTQYNIPYRDDKSNFSNKYARNKIRLDIVPEFEKLNADFVGTMTANIERFQESADVLEEFIQGLRENIFVEKSSGRFEIEVCNLIDLTIGKWYLLFEPFSFSKKVLMDLKNVMFAESGRRFYSDTHVIVLDRKKIILSPLNQAIESSLVANETMNFCWGDYQIEQIITAETAVIKDPFIGMFDRSKIVYPLQIRSWEQGDTFQPIGMKGKKKISDLFIQKKISVLDKKNIPLVVNGNGDIIWVLGIQIDDRYKIQENTQKVLKLVATK